MFLHFKSIPLAAVRRTSCRESRGEAGRPVPERFRYSHFVPWSTFLELSKADACENPPLTQKQSLPKLISSTDHKNSAHLLLETWEKQKNMHKRENLPIWRLPDRTIVDTLVRFSLLPVVSRSWVHNPHVRILLAFLTNIISIPPRKEWLILMKA